ncbi:MAG: 16S rRNA (guanine(966)-N(2))-methyltransferase RsmD [Chloroflexi bacterium]|nr:16S rRNA (guanine(966)-N(2))-methyltransferase RsmD [Chloroflexota bacterium]
MGLPMRVITGKAKGRQLFAPPGDTTRPVTDRVKESLFNILGGSIVGARVLDLFAGVGNIGIEALSRNAREVIFVELHQKVIQVLRRNLAHTGLESGAKIVRGDVFRFLAGDPSPFDLIYVAPPQYQGMWLKALRLLDVPGWLTEEGQVVVQIHPKEFQEVDLQALQLVDQRRYGSTLLCFYTLKDQTVSSFTSDMV